MAGTDTAPTTPPTPPTPQPATESFQSCGCVYQGSVRVRNCGSHGNRRR